MSQNPILTAAIAAIAALATQALAQPQIDAPVLGTIRGSVLNIPGSGFGVPGPQTSLFLQSGATRLRVPSTSSAILRWTDEQITLRVPSAALSGGVLVRTPAGVSNPVPVDVFQYDWWDIPPTAGTNAHPLAIGVDPEGQVWINQEFHLEFQHFDPQTEIVEGLPIPKPPNPGPFASTIFSDHQTQTSILGEDLIIDPQGRVWFTQGGGALYSGAHPNHSRIVCFDPSLSGEQAYRIYNLPGDWNEIIGLAWDEGRGRMWVAQGGLEWTPRLISFDPDRIPFDNHFDFSESLLHQICPPGAPDDDCYRVYDLPETSLHPAHLEVDDQGRVWYTAYWGTRIGVLDPESGAVKEFPLPKAIGKNNAAYIVGSGPWQILRAPDGDIVFCEFFDSTISRFASGRVDDPACLQLDASGANPCVSDWVIPNVDLRNHQLHSIAYDAQGRLWYTMHSSDDSVRNASLGYISADWSSIVRLPSIDGFGTTDTAAAAGIALDPTTGDMYFCEFIRQRLGRLRQVR